MAAVEEGKCVVLVPPPVGFADQLFALVLFPRSYSLDHCSTSVQPHRISGRPQSAI